MLRLAFLMACAAVLGAQVPRLPNGRPDFQGVWRNGAASAAFDLEAHEAGYQIPAGPSVVVDPPDGKLPYTPAAKLQAERNFEERYRDPVGLCHPHGVPRIMVPPFPMEIVQDNAQDGDLFVMLSETEHSSRIIPVAATAAEARPHRKGYVSWMGDSVGHWEGDTLVVDVTSMNGKSWLEQGGNFIGRRAHVVERFTMESANRFIYEARVTDPDNFTQPWTIRLPMERQPKGTELIAYDCVEGERDLVHYRNLEKQSKASGAKKAAGAPTGAKPGAKQ